MADEFNIKDLIETTPLDKNTSQVAQDIMNENDVNKLQNLVHLFNLNQAKKDVLRVFQYNAILDKLSDEALARVVNHADEFTNNDIFNFMQTMQASIDRANKALDRVNESPAIQVNNTQINNISVSENLSRESKDKIKDVVKSILAKSKDLQIVDDTNLGNDLDNNDVQPEIQVELSKNLLKNEEE